MPMKATTEELPNLEEIFVTWGAEPSEIVDVHTLEMKNSMKVLNLKTFGAEEKEAFDEAEAAAWKQCLASGAVALVPREPGELHSEGPDFLGADAICSDEQGKRDRTIAGEVTADNSRTSGSPVGSLQD